MTGILITAGKKPLAGHDSACTFFTRGRGMGESFRHSSPGLCISAFSKGGPGDAAHISSRGVDVLVLGTLIYRGAHGGKALELFHHDVRSYALDRMVQDCDGHFCVVVREGKGFRVVTDHAGIINMYRYRSGGTLVISSSSMAISRSHPVTPDGRSVTQFLRTASVYGSRTIYKEISVLEPASLYTYEIRPKSVFEERKSYWQPPTEVREDMSFKEAADSLMDVLLDSVRALPVHGSIYDLTAGFDSRLILSLLSTFRPFSDIEIFVYGPPSSREVCLVDQYCSSLGLVKDHLALPGDWNEKIRASVQRSLYLTDGEENVFVYAPILLAQEHKARGHAFSVNGLGGELYRDFWWIQEVRASKRPANIDRLVASRVLQYEYDHAIFRDGRARGVQGTRSMLGDEFRSSIQDMDPAGTYNTLQIDNLYLRQKLRRWAGRTISSSSQVIGMLTPLAMKNCLTAAMAVPPRYKRNARMVKSIIEKLSPQLARLEMLNGAPCRNITLANAHAFIPLAVDYGKRGARKIVQKMLSRTILLDRTMTYQQSDLLTALLRDDLFREDFRYDALTTGALYKPDAYAKLYEQAVNGESLYCHQLGNILTLEMRVRNDRIRGELV